MSSIEAEAWSQVVQRERPSRALAWSRVAMPRPRRRHIKLRRLAVAHAR